MVLGLATSNKIWLALFAGVFIVFALLSSFVFPRRWPDFPGEYGRKWFIIGTLALFVAMLFAVNVFAKEEEEASRRESRRDGDYHRAGRHRVNPDGDGPHGDETCCPGRSCGREGAFHLPGLRCLSRIRARGTNATVGPDLGEALQGKDAAFIEESIVEPNAEITQGYQPGIMPGDFGQKLSEKQLADLVAFLSQS